MDLISRQQAIDAMFNLCDRLSEPCYRCENPHIDVIVDKLEQLPSAQPDIIYCGECTKMKVDSVFHDCWCSETGKKVWINHYCGYAERREVTE